MTQKLNICWLATSPPFRRMEKISLASRELLYLCMLLCVGPLVWRGGEGASFFALEGEVIFGVDICRITGLATHLDFVSFLTIGIIVKKWFKKRTIKAQKSPSKICVQDERELIGSDHFPKRSLIPPMIFYKNSTKKRATCASALRADIARGIPALPVTYPTGPTHWTRPLRPGSWDSYLPSDY